MSQVSLSFLATEHPVLLFMASRSGRLAESESPISDERAPSFPALVQCKDGGCSKMLKLHDRDWEAISGLGWHA
jgi:hypothetical protein